MTYNNDVALQSLIIRTVPLLGYQLQTQIHLKCLIQIEVNNRLVDWLTDRPTKRPSDRLAGWLVG